jgi:SAM-dependent methyltransferase
VITSGARVVEVPVNYLPRVGTSSVTGDLGKAVRLGLQMIGYIVAFRLRALRGGRRRAAARRLEEETDVTRTMPAAAAPHTATNGQTDFDAVAADYDESLPAHVMDHYTDKRVAFIREHLPAGAKILDVGCGTGVLAARLQGEGYRVTGADPFAGMLTRMTARDSRIEAVHAQGQCLPFADGTFDLTYCVAVMHHIADPRDVHDTLVEMVRVTKPGGLVLIWDHNPRNPYWPLLMRRVPQDTGAERLIPERELLDGLADGGARPVEVRTLGMMPDFTPRPLLGVTAAVERVVERTPLLNRFCAHNVILARKPDRAAAD